MSVRIIDLTAAKPKTEAHVLSAVAQAAGFTADDHIICIAEFSQIVPPIEGVPGLATVTPDVVRLRDETLENDRRFTSRLMEEVKARRTGDDTVVMYSLLPRVAEAFRTEFDGDSAVSYQSIGKLLSAGRAPAAPPTVWDPSFMDPHEAVAHLSAVVAEHPDGIYQTGLRAHLAKRDPRFESQEGAFSSSQGFIRLLVAMGLRQGVVKVGKEGKNPTNPWLVVATGPTGTPDATPRPAPTGAPANLRFSRIKPATNDMKVLASYYWDLLKFHGFGPYHQVRDELYAALEEVATRKDKNTDDRGAEMLVQAAVATARESWESKRSESRSPARNLPWSDVVKFVRTLLREEPVFLAGAETTAPYFGSNVPAVTDIIDNFEYRLDTQRLRFLLALEDVNISEKQALAAVLFNRSGLEWQEKVQYVVDGMERSGELAVDQFTGALRLLPRKAALHPSELDQSILELADELQARPDGTRQGLASAAADDPAQVPLDG